MPKSLNFCATMGPRKRLQEMSARSIVAVLISFVLCTSLWPSEKLFAQENGGAMPLQISSIAFSASAARHLIHESEGNSRRHSRYL